MRWFLVSFLGLVGTMVVLACIVALLVRHRVRLRHRVDPKVATEAPASWLVDPRAPARLHRRLARVGRAASAVADDHRVARKLRRNVEQPRLVDLAEDLRAHAVRLDHEVARVAVLAPRARRAPLARLATATIQLEEAGIRLAALSAEVRTPPVLEHEAGDLLDVAAQIERLAEAHAALLALDEAAGLRTEPVTAPRSEPSPG